MSAEIPGRSKANPHVTPMNTNDLNAAFDAAEKKPGEWVHVFETIEIDGVQYQRNAPCCVVRDTRRDDSHPFGIFVIDTAETKWLMSRDAAIKFAMSLNPVDPGTPEAAIAKVTAKRGAYAGP